MFLVDLKSTNYCPNFGEFLGNNNFSSIVSFDYLKGAEGRRGAQRRRTSLDF